MHWLQFQGDSYTERMRELLARMDAGAGGGWSAWSDLARECGQDIFREVLFHLTHVEFEAKEAGEHWRNILLHQEALARSQCREVRLSTAVCDYFLHCHPLFDDPALVESRLLALNTKFAFQDELTGLHNRRAFNRELGKELERSRRSGQPFSLFLIDVDHFKGCNDSFGHVAGDKALRRLAAVLMQTARTVDHVSRYGGEEFAIILPSTGEKRTPEVGERHRRAVEHYFREKVTAYGSLTVSIGMATYPAHAKNEVELIAMADKALYKAKALGRNCIQASGDDQRHFPRISLELPGVCWVGNDRPQSFKGRTVNVSLSGMLYESRNPIQVGSRVEAVLTHPGTGSRLSFSANSVRLLDERSDGGCYYMGMRFAEESEAMVFLEQLLEDREISGCDRRSAER